MAAILYICERNGVFPGNITENINSINYKAVDNSSSNYTLPEAAIFAGTNSYEKYNYLKFTGVFTSIGNVSIQHSAGELPANVYLKICPIAVNSGDCASYRNPTKHTSNVATVDISGVGAGVALLSGLSTGSDPAAPAGKTTATNRNGAAAVYSNYIVTQLQTTAAANSGDLTGLTFTISYDEN